jgi:hypothetical protein
MGRRVRYHSLYFCSFCKINIVDHQYTLPYYAKHVSNSCPAKFMILLLGATCLYFGKKKAILEHRYLKNCGFECSKIWHSASSYVSQPPYKNLNAKSGI